jgi:hypothetical protein
VKDIEQKIDELAEVPDLQLTKEEVEEIHSIGDNTGCMELKGGNPSHTGETLPDRWSLTNDLNLVAQRWSIEPARDLVCSHAAVPA